DGGKEIACPAGIIHHWAGVVFIPGAKLGDVLGMLEDYDHHSVYYGPDEERSKIESRDGDHFRVFLRFRRHKVITVVLNTEHDIPVVLKWLIEPFVTTVPKETLSATLVATRKAVQARMAKH